MSEESVQEHLKAEHEQSALAGYLKEVIYGGIDGIVTTFAVVAGFSGAALSSDTTTQLSFLVVLLFGLANLFADGASMGLGNFLSVRSDQDLYRHSRRKELARLRENPEREYEETVEIMVEKGFTQEDASTLASIYRHNENYWLDFMMNHEHEMPDPTGDNPVLTGLATFAAFMVFGAVPLLPFIFPVNGSADDAFLLSILGTVVALMALGVLKWRVIGTNFWASLVEVVVVGSVAAALAFFIGTFFTL